ncbi:MAG TPA: TIGR03118 family protein [Patescibacteria group bacterium]|nr:TIGR03118 family protein [Patescibacteria group bacterium]
MTAVAAFGLFLGAASSNGQYIQRNLAGFQPGMGHFTDPKLNGWGLAFAPDGPFCVADTATGVATFYLPSGMPLPMTITIPAAPGQPLGPVGTPTGIAYNSTSEFVISKNGKSAPALFLFDTLDGLICGWNPEVDPENAIILVDNSTELVPASYTGLALGQNSSGPVLYAADSGAGPEPSLSNNRVDMFDGSFTSLGSFTDPDIPIQFPEDTVFQVEFEDGRLYVTYAGFTAPFGGVVDIHDGDGKLLTPSHFIANRPGAGPLSNPWAIVRAPRDFGRFSNTLLIGNVEDGKINAFDPEHGDFLGTLANLQGQPIVIPGLWDLAFGGGTTVNGKENHLYFTAGPDASDFAGNGLFGEIQPPGRSQQANRAGHRKD